MSHAVLNQEDLKPAAGFGPLSLKPIAPETGPNPG
jgi:hypothetical protein